MKLLNLCAGANRPQLPEWINLDALHDVLAPGTPERFNLDQEANYVNHDLLRDGPIPFEEDTFDGVLASHCIEHWDCQEAVKIMADCRRVLKFGGVLLVSVPDARYFRDVHAQDTVENAERLFGEPIYLPDGETTFLGYGLFNRFHKAVLSYDSLWCYFVRSGFRDAGSYCMKDIPLGYFDKFPDPLKTLASLLNRLPFSLVMAGVKE
jgi:SAM-dependent methyltransferase